MRHLSVRRRSGVVPVGRWFTIYVNQEHGLRWQRAAEAAGYKRVESWIAAAADILEERTRPKTEPGR